MLLSELIRIVKVKDAAVAGTSDVESDLVDLADAAGVLFLTSFGTPAANNLLRVEQGDAADGSDMAEVCDGAVTPGASDEDQWVDLYLPRARYARAVAERGTSSPSGDIWAFLYGLRSRPAANVTAGTINGLALVRPEIEEYE